MKTQTVFPLRERFSLAKTFGCGQCFRWVELGEERFRGVAFGRSVELAQEKGVLTASCGEEEFQTVWKPYLDLDRDYEPIREAVSIDERTAQAAAYGAGLHILRQEPWETLCSFIISQCNNISRIRGIIELMCRNYGEKIGEGAYAFPAAERLAAFSPEELGAAVRCGYRAPYVIAAARCVADGELDLERLRGETTTDAERQLLALPGVGKKVASCVLLFGLGKLDAFPIDVWVRRAIYPAYGRDFDPAAAFGPYAGVAQQYLFFAARSRQLPL